MDITAGVKTLAIETVIGENLSPSPPSLIKYKVALIHLMKNAGCTLVSNLALALKKLRGLSHTSS